MSKAILKTPEDYIEAAARIKVLEAALIDLRNRYSNSPWIVEQVNSVLFT